MRVDRIEFEDSLGGVMVTADDLLKNISKFTSVHIEEASQGDLLPIVWEMTQIVDANKRFWVGAICTESSRLIDHCVLMSSIPNIDTFERIPPGPFPPGFSPVAASTDPHTSAPWMPDRLPFFGMQMIHGNTLILMERDLWRIERRTWTARENENILFCRSSLLSLGGDPIGKILVMKEW